MDGALSLRETSAMHLPEPQPPLETRLDLLAGNLDRARRYGTGLILFVIYRAESARADLERQLLDRVAAMGQRVRRVQFRSDDPLEARDLLWRLHKEPPDDDEVMFVYGLRYAFPELLNSLNYRREFVPEGKWRLLFWALDDEATCVMRDAPDFWDFVNQVVELPEVPPLAERLRLTTELVWETLGGDDELRQLAPDERRARIAVRERLLAELPEDETSRPARADLRYTLGELYYYDGQVSAAEQNFRSALELARQTGSTPLQAGALRNLGEVYRTQGHHKEAVEVNQRAIELAPKWAEPWSELGRVYGDMGHYEDAIIAFRKAIKLAPKLAYPWDSLGSVYLILGRHKDAIAANRKAVELDPTSARLWNNLGTAYKSRERNGEAIAAFRTAIELTPKYAGPWLNLGFTYRDMGRHEEAFAAYQKAIEIDPKLAIAWSSLGDIYDNSGRYEEAIAAHQKAVEIEPKLAYSWNRLGDVYHRIGRYQDAITAYEKAVKVDSRFADRTTLGRLYEQEGRLENATREYQQEVDLHPNEGIYHARLASVLRKLGRTTEAKDHFARARELMTKGTEFDKACIEAIAGNTDAALAYLAHAIEQRPGTRDWARRDPDLAFLHSDPRFQRLVADKTSEVSKTSEV